MEQKPRKKRKILHMPHKYKQIASNNAKECNCNWSWGVHLQWISK